MGLGLSLSYDIIKAHGGELKLNSKKVKELRLLYYYLCKLLQETEYKKYVSVSCLLYALYYFYVLFGVLY